MVVRDLLSVFEPSNNRASLSEREAADLPTTPACRRDAVFVPCDPTALRAEHRFRNL